jgi:hypothetical protein
VAVSCEHGIKPSLSIKTGKFLTSQWLLKKFYATWSWLNVTSNVSVTRCDLFRKIRLHLLTKLCSVAVSFY